MQHLNKKPKMLKWPIVCLEVSFLVSGVNFGQDRKVQAQSYEKGDFWGCTTSVKSQKY